MVALTASRMSAHLRFACLHEGEDGQDMIEYSLLAALISIVAIAVILLIGPYLENAFQDVVNALNSA